ncbi:MAG TPA: squalene synthase HpnC [Terriglobales bacterium]|jgi:squalene synthase HpnC|nr:squalene synthase HpnC [Terriglobales bacterium]
MQSSARHGSATVTQSPEAELRGWERLPSEYSIPENAPSLAEAQAYCQRLAGSHYENFHVATLFLPARLRQHFYNVYSYCRISDDLGDEVGEPHQALALLDAWEAELEACFAGSPRHPVFVALRETVRACDIPKQPFADLLKAFRQDQTVSRYETFEELLGYCRYSANPVGHLVLCVCGYRDAERQLLSDYTCIALQLANFWQDVTVDFAKGRVYLPLEDMRRFGASVEDIRLRRFTPEFRELMELEVTRARQWFDRGLPLVGMVDRELAVDIELFTRGGQEILSAIERQGYNVLERRPVISKMRKLGLLLGAATRRLL